ncbi:hypothetical protein Tco_0726730 [Tanacetum coccineum]|uniref:Uncharacterized protein n=1 Tax=Tanacetum coccineum TaxID=301880 RepID=A0ABQ4YGC5_9ASTR
MNGRLEEELCETFLDIFRESFIGFRIGLFPYLEAQNQPSPLLRPLTTSCKNIIFCCDPFWGCYNTEESKDSEDSDFECDIEDRTDDVHVDIEMFRKNTDPSVEWVGSTEPELEVENNDQFVYEECELEDFNSDIDPNDDEAEAERKKALRKLSKCHKPLDESQLKNRRELYSTKNDKERVRAECRGLVPVFSNTMPSGDSGSNVDGPTDGPSGSQRRLYQHWQRHSHVLNIATATTVSHFNRNIEELKSENKDVYDWLKDIPPQHWARPHCDVLLNNMCEVLNRQLLDGRDNLIITCLEFIREYLMKRIVIVQQVINKSTGPLTPKVTKIFEFIKKQVAQYIITWNGGFCIKQLVNIGTSVWSMWKKEVVLVESGI